jgi:hypothetical protein
MGDGAPVCWAERVLVVRSPPLAQRQQATLEKRLAAAEEELRALTRVLERHEVAGLLPAT